MNGTRWIAMIGAVCVAMVTVVAAEARTRAEYVIDMRDGEVLHDVNGDTALPPASLTKMMTLYLAFEAIRDGRLSLDQTVPVSRRAAAQPASKVGFRAGQRVNVRELIRATAIRSANDAAVVLAEAVAGSERRFAQRMTARARELGMTNTTFRNASGLTERGHLSTARDMAILGRRLFFDFPRYYNLFGRVSTPAFGRTIRNTNRLLSSYRGADGIKTGYTRAAGFNLAASATRGDERVIAVMFGGDSSRSRNERVARLLDLGFARAPSQKRVQPPQDFVAGAPSSTRLASAPVPPARPGGGEAQVVASQRATVNALASLVATTARVEPAAVPVDEPAPGGVALAMAPPPARDSQAGPVLSGDWSVHLGAYAARDAALARLASADFGEMPEIANAGREVHVSTMGNTSVYRVRLTGLAPIAAHEACKRMRAAGSSCEAIPPAR